MDTSVRLYVLKQGDPLAQALCRVIGSDGLREVVIVEAPPATTTPPPEQLSRRETEVAKLIRGGMTNRQIANELVISERTVESHVSVIFAKLSVNTRVQVAVHPSLTP